MVSPPYSVTQGTLPVLFPEAANAPSRYSSRDILCTQKHLHSQKTKQVVVSIHILNFNRNH